MNNWACGARGARCRFVLQALSAEMGEPATRRIDLILYSRTDDMPVIDMVTDDKAERISFLKMRSFWVLEVNDLPLDMTSFELTFSPGLGPSYSVRLFFDEKQPFVFYADLRPGESVPFDEFLIFFSVAISSKKLSFSFEDECYKENPIDGVRTFLNSFDDQYVLWALAFISSQPWISLFKYNEELSGLLAGLVTNLVSKFFFEEESQHKEVDLREYECNMGDVPVLRRKMSICEKTESARLFVETLLAIVRCQLGDAFTYLLSLLYDSDGDFPFMMSLAPFRESRKQNEAEELLVSLIDEFDCFDGELRVAAYLKIYYTVFAIANCGTDIDLTKVIETVKERVEPHAVCELLSRRLCVTDARDECPMEYLVKNIPNLDAVVAVFQKESIAIPAEWIGRFCEAAGIADATGLVLNAISFGVPAHYQHSFGMCSDDGALIMTDNLNPNAVVQPGAIVQRCAILQDNCMLMTNSIILEGAELKSDCYASANAVVVGSAKPIHETALISVPIQFKRGISVGENSVISEHAFIGSGTIIGKNVFVGPSTTIESGCVLQDDQIVVGDITIPAGFVYSNEAVEFTKEIPRVIFREGFGFKRMLSGFFDLDLLLSLRGVAQDKLLNTYFGTMIAYPRQVGRQIAACPRVFEEIDEFVWEMQTMFGVRALLLVIGFWDVAQPKHTADRLMCTLARLTLEETPVSADDLADGKTLLGISGICDHFELFLSKGVPQKAVDLFKRQVSEACETLIVRLTALKYPRDSRVIGSLDRLSKKLLVY